MKIKKVIHSFTDWIPFFRNIYWGNYLYATHVKEKGVSKRDFVKKNIRHLYLQPLVDNKGNQIKQLMSRVDINPVDANMFFYSIDCYKGLQTKRQTLINYTIDYNTFITKSLSDLVSYVKSGTELEENINELVDGIHVYYDRLCKNSKKLGITEEQLNSIEGLFTRSAQSFFDALQRILFINQLLWQTGHKHNGFGRLDLILNNIYENDIRSGVISKDSASLMIRDFLKALHENYWFKSGMLMGDTGQIIIVGGKDRSGNYFSNDLSRIFIEQSMKLHITEPKVFLRYSKNIPDDLFELAMKSIATGIGSPFLSNDDVVIQKLIDFGYESNSAFNYCASACWEPLIIESSADLNNIAAYNFAVPFDMMMLDETCFQLQFDQLLDLYENYLKKYTEEIIKPLEKLEFEEDPLLSLASIIVLRGGKDITKNGAKYNNLGFTSVGMSSVVDSFINIKDLVYDKKEYTIEELICARNKDFNDNPELKQKFISNKVGFGTDNDIAVELTNRFMKTASEEISNYHTFYDGKFKIGYSSPFYITEANRGGATFDGRQEGDPFNVHISSRKKVTPVELLNFASQLDYSKNVINGNVVDFILQPSIINSNLHKVSLMIKKAFEIGVYQMQINVIDSSTLINAKKNPELFTNLIVRVWGFSAYFNDLPEEYQDLLIRRVQESEIA